MRTHEDYIRDVAAFVVMHADLNPSEADMLAGIKLVYGSGPTGTRGVTFYGRWKAGEIERPFVEISAFGQESIVQLTGTTIHELGHVLAGWGAGHGKEWHAACERLGLINVSAAGHDYQWSNFAPWVETYARSIAPPDEGEPVQSILKRFTFGGGGVPMGTPFSLKGCQAGIGTRGGKSRGAGSGSRLRLFQCACHGKGKQLERPVKVRIAADEFDAIHKPCGKPFKRA